MVKLENIPIKDYSLMLMDFQFEKIRHLNLSNMLLEIGEAQEIIRKCSNLQRLDLRKTSIMTPIIDHKRKFICGFDYVANQYFPVDYQKLAGDRFSVIKFISNDLDTIESNPLED